MPELPEVETVVRDVRPHLVDRAIGRVEVGPHALRRAWSPSWKKALLGQRMLRVERRGKWIFIALENGRTLVIHLGMTGQLTVVAAAADVATHTHVVFGLQGTDRELRFRDIRRFGSVCVLEAKKSMADYLVEIGLGPEPFDVPAAYWREQLGKTRRCLKAVLLDQRVVAGVGNIYADEALFAARLHPTRLGNSLTAREIRRLRDGVPEVLTRAIAKRGSTIRDYVGGSGLRGGFQDEFCAYGRNGRPCLRCGATIELMRLAGRATHYCPRCQKA